MPVPHEAEKQTRMLNITANTETAICWVLQSGILRSAQPFNKVIPNPGHIQNTERYRLQKTVMGGETEQYLHMTMSMNFQLSFFKLLRKLHKLLLKLTVNFS